MITGPGYALVPREETLLRLSHREAFALLQHMDNACTIGARDSGALHSAIEKLRAYTKDHEPPVPCSECKFFNGHSTVCGRREEARVEGK